jgi:hypothetical protein
MSVYFTCSGERLPRKKPKRYLGTQLRRFLLDTYETVKILAARNSSFKRFRADFALKVTTKT